MSSNTHLVIGDKPYWKDYYDRNRDRILAYRRQWSLKNPERRKEIEHRSTYKDPARRLLNASRKRATKAGIPFSITKQDIYIPSRCPALKHPFEHRTPFAPSIDRIDNSKGYEPGNIQVISKKANMMKSNATPRELELFAKWVLGIE